MGRALGIAFALVALNACGGEDEPTPTSKNKDAGPAGCAVGETTLDEIARVIG